MSTPSRASSLERREHPFNLRQVAASARALQNERRLNDERAPRLWTKFEKHRACVVACPRVDESREGWEDFVRGKRRKQVSKPPCGMNEPTGPSGVQPSRDAFGQGVESSIDFVPRSATLGVGRQLAGVLEKVRGIRNDEIRPPFTLEPTPVAFDDLDRQFVFFGISAGKTRKRRLHFDADDPSERTCLGEQKRDDPASRSQVDDRRRRVFRDDLLRKRREQYSIEREAVTVDALHEPQPPHRVERLFGRGVQSRFGGPEERQFGSVITSDATKSTRDAASASISPRSKPWATSRS